MNKFVKLPLFLGVCGAICSGALATINHFTAPVISNRAENKKNQNYLDLMGITTADKFESKTPSDALKNAGINEIMVITFGGNVGVVYTGAFTDGFTKPQWNLQLGIKEGIFTGLKYSADTPDTVGRPIVEKFAKALEGKSVEDSLTDVSQAATKNDKSVTVIALTDFVSQAALDYAANYM